MTSIPLVLAAPRSCARLRPFRAGVALFASALATPACRSTPEPGPLVPPTGLQTRVEYHAGLVLEGGGAFAAAEPIDADPAHAYVLRCRIVYLERIPPTTLAPLMLRTELVATLGERRPVMPSSRFGHRTLAGSGAEAERLREDIEEGMLGRSTELADFTAALPMHATVGFAAQGEQPESDPAADAAEQRALPVQVRFFVGRSAEEISISVARRGPPAIPEHVVEETDLDPTAALAPTRGETIQHELLFLQDRPALDGDPLALLLPSPFGDDAGRAVAVFLSIASPPSPAGDPTASDAHARLVQECLQGVEENVRETAARASPGSNEAARQLGLTRMLDRLAASDDPRAALVSLASATRARIALDLALTSEEPLLARFAREIESAESRGALTDDDLSWFLDRTAARLLARSLMEGDDALEVEALLVNHAGYLGRYPSAILEALEAAPDRAAFEQACLAENLAILHDDDAGTRVRAFDWLVQRGRAPEGFDPLAPMEERRAALERAEAKAREQVGSAEPAEPRG